MLIESPRLTDDDRRAWAQLEAADARNARRIGSLVDRSLRVVGEFLERCPDAWVGCSWGKDSVVTAHLAHQVDPAVPIGHESHGEWSSPEAALVRDAYLGLHPTAYIDVPAPPVPLGDGVGWPEGESDWPLNRELGPQRLTGVRAAESGTRRLSAATHGDSTRNVCRPILRWPTWAVFAYLWLHDLPTHPAYAMSMGGALDRERIRVDHLFGARGADMGRREWERRYYPDAWVRLQAARMSPNVTMATNT